MDSTQFLAPPLGPGVVRELDGVFVAVNLHALFHAIILVLEPGKPSGIAGPHIPFGGTLDDPFGQNLASATGLTDPEGEDASLERIGHAGHRADQRVTIGRIGDRAVDHLGQLRLFQQRHPGHRIGDMPFEAFKIVREQLEAEILRERVILGDPMRPAIGLIGAKVEAVLLLPQVVA